MGKIQHLLRKSFVRNKGYFFTNIIVGLVGILVVIFALLLKNDQHLMMIFSSIGTSIIAADIVAFLDMLRNEGLKEFDEEIYEISTKGGIERIYKRRDLEEYADLVKTSKKSIDVMGYSLKGFYESNKDIILDKCNQNSDYLVRIILVDPESKFSMNRDVEENEQGSQLFKETYTNLLKWSKKTQGIQIRLIDAPLSDMIYRIDDTMYTGPYFYRVSSKETYTNRLNSKGWLFQAYQDNFDKMWEHAKGTEDI